MKEVVCPLQYETCIRSMLYNYRIKNRKDFYECDIKKIEKAFEKCNDSLQCMNQVGGSKIINNKILTILNLKIKQLKKKKEHLKIKLDEYNKILSI